MGQTVISEDGRFEWDEAKEEMYYEWRKNFIT